MHALLRLYDNQEQYNDVNLLSSKHDMNFVRHFKFYYR